MPCVKPPVFFRDEVERAVPALESAIQDVDERLESVEGILGQLADFFFLAFAIRFVVWITTICHWISQHNIVVSPHFLREKFLDYVQGPGLRIWAYFFAGVSLVFLRLKMTFVCGPDIFAALFIRTIQKVVQKCCVESEMVLLL